MLSAWRENHVWVFWKMYRRFSEGTRLHRFGSNFCTVFIILGKRRGGGGFGDEGIFFSCLTYGNSFSPMEACDYYVPAHLPCTFNKPESLLLPLSTDCSTVLMYQTNRISQHSDALLVWSSCVHELNRAGLWWMQWKTERINLCCIVSRSVWNSTLCCNQHCNVAGSIWNTTRQPRLCWEVLLVSLLALCGLLSFNLLPHLSSLI